MKSHLTFPDEELDELINGESILMLPHPNYNKCRVRSRIWCLLDEYLKDGPATAIPPRISLYLSEKDRFIPDGMVVCDRDKIKHDGVYGAPDLVVEVLSPSTVMRNRSCKMRAYQEHGVREYWIVTPETKTIEQYILQEGAFVLHDAYSIYPDYELEDMTPEEKAAALAPLKCWLFDDLEIDLEDIFNKLLPIV